MPPLRRRYLILSVLLGILGLAFGALMVSASRLWAEGTLPATAIPLFDWISLTGVVSLVGVAVQWGATRERLKDITTLEDRIDGRFNRVERQIDALFTALQAERRSEDRTRIGERVQPEANGA